MADTEAGPAPVVEGYRVEGLLGAGGMGSVWRATRASDGRPVAIKVAQPKLLAAGKRMVARFLREIEVCKRFVHPNVVSILDGGKLPGTGEPFLVMELLEGCPLAGHPEFGDLSEDVCRRVIEGVAAAFAYFHPDGLVHRDLKPANIFMESSGRVVLLDFGLVHLAEAAATQLTRTGEIPGTLATLAPEQLRCQRLGAFTDVYQLGVTCYVALTGSLPYGQGELLQLALGGRVAAPARVDRLRPELSAALGELVARCIDPAPGRRPQGAADLLEALGGPGEGPRTSANEPVAAGLTRRLVAPALGLVAAVVLAGAVLWRSRGTPETGRRAPPAGFAGELAPLRESLLAQGHLPSATEATVLGELLDASGVAARSGLAWPGGHGALGLYDLASQAARPGTSAAWSAADALYGALLERHGPFAVRPARGTALEGVVAAAVGAGRAGALAERLRVARAAERDPDRRGALDVARARALLADHHRRAPNDTFVWRELTGFLSLGPQRDPALLEAAAALAPLVAAPPEGVRADALAFMYLDALHGVRDGAAQQACLALAPRLMEDDRFRTPVGEEALALAASLLVLRPQDGTKLRSKELLRAAVPALERMARGASTPAARARFTCWLAVAVGLSDSAPRALELLEGMAPLELAPLERWRWYWAKGWILELIGPRSRARETYVQGLAVAPPGDVAAYFQRRRTEVVFEDFLGPRDQ